MLNAYYQVKDAGNDDENAQCYQYSLSILAAHFSNVSHVERIDYNNEDRTTIRIERECQLYSNTLGK